MNTDNNFWQVEVFRPNGQFDFEYKYYYFDDLNMARKFYRNAVYSSGMPSNIKLVTLFDMLKNPDQLL